MSVVVDILSQHQVRAWGMASGSPDTCTCGSRILPDPGPGEIRERRFKAFAKHQSEMINEMGNIQ